jgi:hypothetical protein
MTRILFLLIVVRIYVYLELQLKKTPHALSPVTIIYEVVQTKRRMAV